MYYFLANSTLMTDTHRAAYPPWLQGCCAWGGLKEFWMYVQDVKGRESADSVIGE